LIECCGQRWHNPAHESVRTPNNATRTPKTTSAVDACGVGVDCVNCAVAGDGCAVDGAAEFIGRPRMNNLENKTDSELRGILQASRQTLAALIDSLTDRPDMQNAVHRLMRPDDMLETFSELAVKDPDLMRLVLQACVAALVNVQSVEAVDVEMKRRAVVGN